ncbi:MAG: DNA-binding transcriptional regulator [Planctomycetaceae bacterium]|jgi:LacI family transcriptional regulator|nr:DNA-binding transcriptional regulator [Planctomycetaceae bacterium]
MIKNKQVLLVIESARAYGRGIIEGVSRYIQERGRWTIQYEEQGILTTVPTWLKEWHGDGIICRTGRSPLGLHLRKLNVPIVELLGDGQRFVSEVQSDAVVAGNMAAEHFIERGLRYFAYYSYGNTWWGQARGDAFTKALLRKGFESFTLLSQSGEKAEAFPEWKPIYEKPLLRWLAKLPKPIGIWCAADTIAQRVHAAAMKSGLVIPDEIALLGIDNDEHLCNVLTPTLSSIDPNSVVVGYNAAKLLDAKMTSGDSKERAKKQLLPETLPIKITPQCLVMRQSTDVIAVDDPKIVAIARYIREHALSGLLVAEVAREFHISKRTLERRYKKLFGKTVDQEITLLRIEQAKFLLRTTVMPVADVGEQTGFDRSYFIKAFHRIVGVPPSVYRNTNRVGILGKEKIIIKTKSYGNGNIPAE